MGNHVCPLCFAKVPRTLILTKNAGGELPGVPTQSWRFPAAAECWPRSWESWQHSWRCTWVGRQVEQPDGLCRLWRRLCLLEFAPPWS